MMQSVFLQQGYDPDGSVSRWIGFTAELAGLGSRCHRIDGWRHHRCHSGGRSSHRDCHSAARQFRPATSGRPNHASRHLRLLHVWRSSAGNPDQHARNTGQCADYL